MKLDRRQFLTSVGTIWLMLAFLPKNAFAGMVRFYRKVLWKQDYVDRINQWFYLANTDATHQGNLQLTTVEDCSSNSRVEKFCLTLRSDLQALPMPSGYYAVSTEPFGLFVKHTHEANGRQFYIAEFALLR